MAEWSAFVFPDLENQDWNPVRCFKVDFFFCHCRVAKDYPLVKTTVNPDFRWTLQLKKKWDSEGTTRQTIDGATINTRRRHNGLGPTTRPHQGTAPVTLVNQKIGKKKIFWTKLFQYLICVNYYAYWAPSLPWLWACFRPLLTSTINDRTRIIATLCLLHHYPRDYFGVWFVTRVHQNVPMTEASLIMHHQIQDIHTCLAYLRGTIRIKLWEEHFQE